MSKLSLFVMLVAAAGCGRSSLYGDNNPPDTCPPGQHRNASGVCVVTGPDGGPFDMGHDGPIDMNPIDLGDGGGDGGDGGGDGGMCTSKREICNNGIDDNCDGLVDCQDPQCTQFPACMMMHKCDPQNPDCNDVACENNPACIKGLEICNNGIDDDHNGLTDCKDPACATFPGCQVHMCNPAMPDCGDPACINDPHCQNLVCKPTVDFGSLAHNNASSSRNVDTTGMVDVVLTPCAPGGGGEVVTEFTVLSAQTAVKLDYAQAGDHSFALFQAGTGEACNAHPLAQPCFDPKGAVMGSHTFVLDAGHYYLIVSAFTKSHQGKVSMTLSTPPTTAPKEICNNGVDDDMNGLTDCADPACVNDPSCTKKECKPNLNVGTTPLTNPPTDVTASFNTNGQTSPDFLNCAGKAGGGVFVVQFHMAQSAGILMNWDQTGDHVVGLYKLPPPGQGCDALPVGGGPPDSYCYDPSQRSMDTVDMADNLEPGDYLLIFEATKPGTEGHIDIDLQAFINKNVELCHNGIDDDGNGLTDCKDPKCFSDPGCGAPVCSPDVNLGTLPLDGQPKMTTVNTVGGVANETTSCAQGGGLSRIIEVTLAQNAGMTFQCTMGKDHVLALDAAQGPRDSCDKLEVECADPNVIPFGCNYEIPNLQPGTYYVIVEAFKPGDEGSVQIALGAVTDRALEICNNGIDDDMDGFTDCMDRKCATSPYCVAKACKADATINPMPTNGTAVLEQVVTMGRMATASPTCALSKGGGDAVVAITMPQTANLTVQYSEIGTHVMALYPVIAQGLQCDSSKATSCQATMAGMGGIGSGTLTFPAVPAGDYWFVIAADKPGDEGSVTVRFTASP